MKSGRFEDESPRAALCHRIKNPVAVGVDLRAIDEQYVERHCTHPSAVELVEQIGVTGPAPRPAAFPSRAEKFDRAFVDLYDHDIAGGLWLERPPPHDAVEDRILGRVQRSRVGPIPAEPANRAEGEQWEERKFQPERKMRKWATVAALDLAPSRHEAVAKCRQRRIDPGQHAVFCSTGHYESLSTEHVRPAGFVIGAGRPYARASRDRKPDASTTEAGLDPGGAQRRAMRNGISGNCMISYVDYYAPMHVLRVWRDD